MGFILLVGMATGMQPRLPGGCGGGRRRGEEKGRLIDCARNRNGRGGGEGLVLLVVREGNGREKKTRAGRSGFPWEGAGRLCTKDQREASQV